MIKNINIKSISVFIIVILIFSCSKQVDEVASATWEIDESENIVPVEVLSISKGKLYPDVKASGVISGTQEAFVVSETRGIIENIGFQIGDKLLKNDVLVKVDDKILKLSMEQAKQQYDSAKLELDSLEVFYKQGTTSLANLTRARSSANGALAFYEISLKAYEDSTITSPISGVVASKEPGINVGNYITPGIKIAKIVDLSQIKVEVSVGERQIGLVELGANVSISVGALPDKEPLKGKVVAIAGGSDESTGSYSVIIKSDNVYKDMLRAGMSCSVVISTNQGNNQYIIPTDSIVVRDGKDYIFTDENGIATPMEIVKGIAVGNRTSVKSGVDDTTQVIVSGLSSIKPGVKVNSKSLGKSGDLL